MKFFFDRSIVGGNWWLNQTVPKIPLGIISRGSCVGEVAWQRFPMFEGVIVSDTLLVCGGTGVGKSVEAKKNLWFRSQKQPIIGLDWAGSDLYLMKLPNSRPKNLPPHTPPAGIPGRYLWVPSKNGRPKQTWEEVYRPNLAKYDQAQLEALGFSTGAAKYLRTILSRYGPFRDLEVLYEFIEHFPTEERESIRKRAAIQKGVLKLRHNKIYRANDVMVKQSKESIKKILPGLIEKGMFRLDNKEEFDFEKAFLKGENIIVSFNDKEVGRVEINYFMGCIIRIRRQHPESKHYVLYIEEAHKVLEGGGAPIDEVIEDFILVCRKESIGLILVMPEVISLSSQVLTDMKNIITGQFKGENASKLIAVIGYDDRAKIIPYLKYDRFPSPGQIRAELLSYNKDKQSIFTYVPFNCPCEIHREVSE